MVASTEDKWAEMSEIFNTCTPISNSSDTMHLYSHYMNGYLYMAMTDYPYPAYFLEPMPAWPVDESVKPFENIPTAEEHEAQQKAEKSIVRKWLDSLYSTVGATFGYGSTGSSMPDRERELYQALANSTNVYFNYTCNYPCTNLSDWEGTGDLDGYGWNILACNQLAMPIGYGPDSMFLEQSFDYDQYTAWCQSQFGLTPDYTWALR